MMRVKASVYDESGTKEVSPLPRFENVPKFEEGRTFTAALVPAVYTFQHG